MASTVVALSVLPLSPWSTGLSVVAWTPSAAGVAVEMKANKLNVFVLCTGRCGSVTFIEAAKHISNYSAGHETRTALNGHARFAYPVGHIEADNRLAWLLGRLDARYGDEAFCVHLQRDILDTARSFLKRKDRGIMRAYRADILMSADKRNDAEDLAFCIDYRRCQYPFVPERQDLQDEFCVGVCKC